MTTQREGAGEDEKGMGRGGGGGLGFLSCRGRRASNKVFPNTGVCMGAHCQNYSGNVTQDHGVPDDELLSRGEEGGGGGLKLFSF